MGWDAYSSVKYKPGTIEIADPDLRKIFKKAVKNIQKKVRYADFRLEHGGLDVSHSGEMLEKATGESVWDEKGWSAAKVKRLAKSANWDFPVEGEDNKCYYESAKAFLNICAQNNLSVRFSW